MSCRLATSINKEKKAHIIDQRLLMRQRDFSQRFVVLLNIYYNAYKLWISQTVTNKIISK